MALRLYYERHRLEDVVLGETRHTLDGDFQHRFGLGAQQDLSWGAGYRVSRDNIDNSFTVIFDPDRVTDQWFSAFVQDEVALRGERLHLTLGSKFEYNDYSGFEFQPGGRLLWLPAENHAAWAAVARAVRTPSRAETHAKVATLALPAFAPDTLNTLAGLRGNTGLRSEELLALEAGYRLQRGGNMSLELAGFYNLYDQLRTFEPEEAVVETDPVLHRLIAIRARNKMDGRTFGIEAEGIGRIQQRWRVRMAYTYLQMDMELDDDSRDVLTSRIEDESPHHQFLVHSSLDLPGDVEWDLIGRFVDELPALDVDRYFQVDVRLGWHPVEALEVALVGQNLLDDRQPEFRTELVDAISTEFERGFYGRLRWSF